VYSPAIRLVIVVVAEEALEIVPAEGPAVFVQE
jgi:hypothetical protein